MPYWRTSRHAIGGFEQRAGSPHAQFTQRDPISIPVLPPAGSILKPSEVSEPPFNKFQVVERALIVVVTGTALFASVFVLLFVELQ